MIVEITATLELDHSHVVETYIFTAEFEIRNSGCKEALREH